MKDFIHSNGFKVLLAVIFIMFGLMLYSSSANGSFLSNLLDVISTPMQKVSAIVTNNAAVATNNVTRSADALQAENNALKQQINELNNKLVDYYEIKQENAQYSQYLELKKNHKDFQFVSASVIGRDPNDLFHNFTIDKGNLAGVKVNDPVITNAGLVGWVSSVNMMNCKVTTILSPDTSVGVMDNACGESGVVSSNIKLSDQGLAKMSYLAAGTKTKIGDIVVTSGIGGIYPKGLMIGKLKQVKNEEYDVSLCAVVEPFVNVKTLHDVFVITSFQGQGEILSSSSPSSNLSSSKSSSNPSSSSAAPVSSGGR